MVAQRAGQAWSRVGGGAAWMLAASFLLLANLSGYPRIWFDEGWHLLAAQRLAQTGAYRFGPAVGPTVFYPVAASFRFLGEGVWQGRVVVVAYGLLALALGYLLARRIGDDATAWLVLGLWLSSPALNFVGWGRQVLGEVPAWTFFLAGVLAWHRSLTSRGRLRWAMLGGGSFGLAIISKNQFLLLVPVFLLMWVADRFYYRRMGWGAALVTLGLALLVPLAWYAVLPHLAGSTVAQMAVEEWRTAPARSIWIGDPRLMVRNARFVLGPRSYLCLAVPSLLLALPWLRRRDDRGLTRGFLWLFAVLWLGWYVFFSIGWERYAFAGLAAAAPFVARLLLSLWRRARPLPGPRVAAAALVAGVLLAPLVGRGIAVLTHVDRTAQQMAAYIEEHVPQDARIETWEPEIAFLVDRRYHSPPRRYMDAFSRAKALGEPPPPYDPLMADPDYILVGEFGWWTGIYPPDFLREHCRLVTTIGTYALYEVRW